MTSVLKNEIRKVEALGSETIQAIFKGQKEKVIRLYGKVERMFGKGNSYTRSLVSNKFILPLSQLLEMNYSWGREYLALFPVQLKTEYYRQIYSSGI